MTPAQQEVEVDAEKGTKTSSKGCCIVILKRKGNKLEEYSYKDGGVHVRKSIHMMPRSNIYFAPDFNKYSNLVTTK